MMQNLAPNRRVTRGLHINTTVHRCPSRTSIRAAAAGATAAGTVKAAARAIAARTEKTSAGTATAAQHVQQRGVRKQATQ